MIDLGSIRPEAPRFHRLFALSIVVRKRDIPKPSRWESCRVPVQPSNSLFAGGHHARLIDERVPYHVISRVFQGRHLLRPGRELNEIIIGVVAKARDIFPSVKLFGLAFLSNHVHMMLQGASHELPAFIGFIKREISRRWGGRSDVRWPGTMWHKYLATALPTDESQAQCLAYILAQGAKEHLVDRPQDWPGVHVAKAFMSNGTLCGKWFDASGFARAVDAQRGRAKPLIVKRADYIAKRKISFDAIPAWTHLPRGERFARARKIIADIVQKARETRRKTGQVVLGVRRILQTPLDRISQLPALPWYEQRRRMICWANRRHPATKRFIALYWKFQDDFLSASAAYRAGDIAAPFPLRSFLPGIHRPI